MSWKVIPLMVSVTCSACGVVSGRLLGMMGSGRARREHGGIVGHRGGKWQWERLGAIHSHEYVGSNPCNGQIQTLSSPRQVCCYSIASTICKHEGGFSCFTYFTLLH